MRDKLVSGHTDYHKSKCYQKSVTISMAPAVFVSVFSRGDRTVDQMVQAARSGKQNIVEGVMAWNTSSETMLKLLGVARASQEELLEDYLDYLRTRNLVLWEKDSKPAAKVRRLVRTPEESAGIFRDYMSKRSYGACVNIMIFLIRQCNFLLGQLQRRVMVKFMEEGGFRE